MALAVPKPFDPHGLVDKPSTADDSELDLLVHARRLWRYRLLLVVVTALTAGGAYSVSMTMTPIYVAEAKLWVTSPKFATDTVAPLNSANFKALLENRGVVSELIKELHLDEPPFKLSAEDFVTQNLTVTEVRDASVYLVAVRMPDPGLAARTANRYVELVADLTRSLQQQDSFAARDFVSAEVKTSRDQMDQAISKRDAFRRQAQLELVKKDVETLLDQRGDLRRLNVEIEAVRGQVAQDEVQLRSKERIDTLRRSVDSDPTLLGSANALTKESAAVLSLQLKSEQMNDVYQQLDSSLSWGRTRLSGLEHQRAQLVDTLKLGAPELAQLKQLYERESELSRLETEVELTTFAYMEVSQRLGQVRLQIAGRTEQFRVVDRALPPTRPIWPRPFRNAVMASAVVCLLTMIAVLLAGFVRQLSLRA